MLNGEKYEKELNKLNYYFGLYDGKLAPCDLDRFYYCDFNKVNGKPCSSFKTKWLLEKYKEPTLTEEGITYLSNLLKPYGLGTCAFRFNLSTVVENDTYKLTIADEHGIIINLAIRQDSEMRELFKKMQFNKVYTTKELGLKHYKKEVLMMCDKQDIIDYCHEMEQRLFQSMLIIDKLMERKELNEKDKELLEEIR